MEPLPLLSVIVAPVGAPSLHFTAAVWVSLVSAGEVAVSGSEYDDRGLSSTYERKETAMAEPWLDIVEKVTEFFSADQIEASARRTKFVQRASKITGQLFLTLVTLGRWRMPKTSLAQLVAKAAQLEHSVDVRPEALQQRMNERALAFLQDLLQTAFAKLHTGGTWSGTRRSLPRLRAYILPRYRL